MIDSGKVSRISPKNTNSSWDILALDNDNIIAGRYDAYFVKLLHIFLLYNRLIIVHLSFTF